MSIEKQSDDVPVEADSPESKIEVAPVEPIPGSLAEWIEIDRRVDMLGFGNVVHGMSKHKNTAFDFWCAHQKKPQDETIAHYLNMTWSAFILKLRGLERQKREMGIKNFDREL